MSCRFHHEAAPGFTVDAGQMGAEPLEVLIRVPGERDIVISGATWAAVDDACHYVALRAESARVPESGHPVLGLLLAGLLSLSAWFWVGFWLF